MDEKFKLVIVLIIAFFTFAFGLIFFVKALRGSSDLIMVTLDGYQVICNYNVVTTL